LRIDRGILPAALGQKFLEGHRRALDFIGVILRFDGETHLPLFEAVQDLRDSYRMDALVVDGADDAALGEHPAEDKTGLARLGFERIARRRLACRRPLLLLGRLGRRSRRRLLLRWRLRWSLCLYLPRAEHAETGRNDQQADTPGVHHANIPFHSALLPRRRF